MLSTLKKMSITLGCSLLSSFAYGQEVKILTYNIYHGEQHYNPGNSNLEEIAKVINTYQPDFVAMQEVDSMTVRTAGFNQGVRKDLMKELAKLTGMKAYFGKAMDYNQGGYGEGILTRFPEKPTTHALPIPKGGEPRALMTLEHTFPNGKKIILAGTHLCHEYEENRTAQIQETLQILEKEKLPAVVMGDFNFNPRDIPFQIVTKKMKDVAVIYGKPQPTWPYDNPKERLDHIFIDKKHPWKVKKVEVIKTSNASDHLPVLVTLEI
ncbi:endonuclease/exonuclease/phosphatase family protein [Elizabethkingia sp. JS20170427COW]|uniref:endonuclease/exonuclease/phosphatase family protein n=1 Tax=Elizabethkingia sp. JS20170427COW TaxID=2583851 RepID=UPI0011108931|nr:endonuclease/exonuclease/phosphatase family protein [Elizabethkingia sp. JS20170427COW]QCX54235.1 endonuclease [Elizabethkingia sp. JS20170427COW]